MKLKRLGAPLALLAAAAISLTACASNEGSAPATTTAKPTNLSGTLNGIGSSAQGAAETTWISGFQQANPKATVNYDPQGSGAGRKSFIGGSADFAGSDAALNATELAGTFTGCAAGSKGIDLPVYISPIAIAFHVTGSDKKPLTDLKLDAATIAGIFSGQITTWNDPKIKAMNSSAPLPSTPITVVHRSDDSGTTQNFTDYLAQNAPSVWTKPAGQTFPYTVGDAAKGTSGVAAATKGAQDSIAYIDESGSAGLSIAQLKVGSNFEKISADGAAKVVASSPVASGRAANDLAIQINRKDTSSGAWPLVLVSYVIACQQYNDAAKAALVKGYVNYVISGDAQNAASQQAGSAPLASDLTNKISKAVASIK